MAQEYTPIKKKLHEIIFEADTPLGKWFDIVLLAVIILSVATVALESVEKYQLRFGALFYGLEWIFTILFTIEYLLRLYCVRKPLKYAVSFFGVIDFLALLPTYLSLFFAGTQTLIVIRALRLLRVFRIFKLFGFLRQGRIILLALRSSREKIAIFFFFVMLLVTILGSIMYLVEGQQDSGFTDIPHSVYWAIVTLTTVGYGDIAPVTPLGQFIASFVMILGYSVIAVPTGIVSAELVSNEHKHSRQVCEYCSKEGHDSDAEYCKYCGNQLNGE